MNTDYVFEAIGIIATLLVSASLCMKYIKGLRILNLTGSVFFLVYGLLIRSPSIMLLNSFAIAVNVYYLVRMIYQTTKTDLFDVLFIDSLEDDMLRRFVRFHSNDIKRYFPSFDDDFTSGTLVGAECCFILRETLPVSLIVYKRGTDNDITILVDYVVPAFRDMKNAQFFFSSVTERITVPGSVYLAKGEVKSHAKYLKRMGFLETGREGNTVFFCKVV